MKALPPSGPARRRAIVRLVLAAGALGVLVWYQFLRVPAGSGSGTSNTQARTPGQAGVGQGALPSPLGFEKMEPVADEPESARNPFRYGVPPPRVQPPVTGPPQPVQPFTPAPPTPPPGPPRIQLTLLGLLTVEGPDGAPRRQATLKDPSGSLFHVLEGDKFDGRYRMIRIGMETVIVSYLDGSGQITLAVAK